MPRKGQLGLGTGPRPHTWIVGPDPIRHAKHTAFLRSRAQANYRNEPWAMSFEDYEAAWGDQWHRRGRGTDCLQLVRINCEQPWSATNVRLVDRTEFRLNQEYQKKVHQGRRNRDRV